MGIFSFFSRAAISAPRPGSSPPAPHLAAAPAVLEHGSITIFAADRRLSELVPAAGVAVPALPYLVGRIPEPDDNVSRQPVGLFLRDAKPYRLSRRHFAIVRRDAEYWVIDGASHLGTVVNGHRIGRQEGSDAARLHAGENAIVAGGPGSQYAFRIVVG